jgi:hypothetical protein
MSDEWLTPALTRTQVVVERAQAKSGLSDDSPL